MVNPLFVKKPQKSSIWWDIQPERDLTHFVKCPCYIRLQWKRTFLPKWLKVPPALHQLPRGLSQQMATQLLTLAHKYRPETKKNKEGRTAGKEDVPTKRAPVYKQRSI